MTVRCSPEAAAHLAQRHVVQQGVDVLLELVGYELVGRLADHVVQLGLAVQFGSLNASAMVETGQKVQTLS